MSDRAPSSRPAEWEVDEERGSATSLRFLVWCIRHVGAAPLRLLLAPVAFYYCLFAPKARRASLDYLSRVAATSGSQEQPSIRDVYRHLFCFAEVILDRLLLWSDGLSSFEIAVHGEQRVKDVIEKHGGAFLLGAHIGSFDMLRVVAREAAVPVTVVMDTSNAEKINEAFLQLDPTSNVRVINFNPSSVGTSFEIRRCIERGELVAIMGDRIRQGVKHRVAYANFLGAQAAFPQGPLLLPIVMQAPVVLTVAIRTGPRAYDVFLEPLADVGFVAPGHRKEAIQARVDQYAARLEHYCLRAPLQWFNFFDFWAKVENARR